MDLSRVSLPPFPALDRLPRQVKPRRPGDIEAMYADPSLAMEVLGWRAKRGLDEMCMDTWRWQSSNPNGYKEA